MPNTREKLIELINEMQKNGVRYIYVKRVGCEMKEEVPNSYLADHLIAHGVTVQNWMPLPQPPKGE